MKNFYLNVVIRSLFMAAICLLLAYVFISTEWFFAPLVLILLFFLSIIDLIHYVRRSERNLQQFLLNISQKGFTSQFNAKGKAGDELNKIFNHIQRQFQEITIEKESHYQYLKTLNENLGIAIFSFDNEDKIRFLNPAAKNLFKKPIITHIKHIEEVDSALARLVKTLESGQRQVYKTTLGNEVVQLSIETKDFIIHDQSFRLVLIQNIHHELEEKELEAWQKLTSVLTHEIMNSVTPIASLSSAMSYQINTEGLEMNPSDFDDFKKSLSTIENRSKGLMKFVNAYKDFSKDPDLHHSTFDLKDLIEHVISLFQTDVKKSNVSVITSIPNRDWLIKADHDLIEQVVINLFKNAVEALAGKSQAQINISLKRDVKATKLIIADNGPGIPEEHLEKIYIPFFTTKKTGSGIGLSFARKVLDLHHGSMSINSSNNGTSVSLTFQ